MGNLVISSFSSLVGSMSLDFVIKLSEVALKKGHSVNVWLSGNGTMLVKKGQKKFQDYSALEEQLRELMNKGVSVTACEACAEARGYHKEDLIEGVDLKAADYFLAWCFNADRVLHIGSD